MRDEQIYILGNCALDNRDTYLETADYLYKLMKGKNWILKASYDKANRTSIKGGRGLGLEECVKIFKEVKQKYPDIKLTTDVHETHEVEKLAGIIDVVQVPAFLCRQTSLIVECAKHFDVVNVKKAQHLGPNNITKSVDKIKNTNPACAAWLTERGTSLGYDHLIVDFTIVDEIKKYYDKMIFDVTHATQRSRAVHTYQGDPKLSKRFFKAAKIMGYDGIFAECHPRPSKSVSDGDCMILLPDMEELMRQKEKIDKAIK